MAYSPVFDSTWDTRTAIDPNMSTCKVCNAQFTPKVYGQAVCSSKCGAEVDKKQIAERIAKQQQPEVVV